MYLLESKTLADIEDTYAIVGEHTPLEWNTFFMGETEHYPVLPPMPECIKLAHVYNRKHCSARETRANLNKLFPGHRIHYKLVIEYCAQCPVCQKNRRGMLEMDVLEPITKHLKPAHRRSRVGIDTNFMSPTDKNGHTCIHVIVNHFTNFVALYPAKDHSARSAAQSLFEFFITYGSYDEIASDPGSEFTATLVRELTQLFGTRQRFSMVGVHTSSGVEGTNNLVNMHLRALCTDKRFRDRWGDKQVLGLVQFIINDSVCGETGLRRFDNMFGSEAGTYFRLPEQLPERLRAHEYLRLLDDDLRHLAELSQKAHAQVIEARRSGVTEETQNKYLPGELVLVRRDPDKPLPSKLSLPFTGPYEVLQHDGNAVRCRHLAAHHIADYPVTRLKIFHGSLEDAIQAANEDYDQTKIDRIDGWRGDPYVRTTMEFRVHFVDGDVVWLPFNPDLEATLQYGDYVNSIACLRHLTFRTAAESAKWLARKRKDPMPDLHQGMVIFVNLRWYGYAWYDNLHCLPDRFDRSYVVEFVIRSVRPTYITAYCHVFNDEWVSPSGPTKLDSYFFFAWVHMGNLDHDTMTLITPDFCRDHPEILSKTP